MSDERWQELGLSRGAFLKKLVAGAFVAPVVVSFGLDAVAEAATRQLFANQTLPNQTLSESDAAESDCRTRRYPEPDLPEPDATRTRRIPNQTVPESDLPEPDASGATASRAGRGRARAGEARPRPPERKPEDGDHGRAEAPAPASRPGLGVAAAHGAPVPMAGLLSAALVVRNESAVLDACLASIREVVDEIVVVDTGSVDDSAEIAARHGARVIHHAWRDDFAEVRNVALDAAQGDWILYIDADERLAPVDRRTVEQLLRGADAVAFRVLLRPQVRSTPYFEYRIWRSDPRIRFHGQIHEKVTPAISAVAAADGRPIDDCRLLLTHVGYEGDQTHKHRRNLPLLRAELAREPDNLFNRHHLARVLTGLGPGGRGGARPRLRRRAGTPLAGRPARRPRLHRPRPRAARPR